MLIIQNSISTTVNYINGKNKTIRNSAKRQIDFIIPKATRILFEHDELISELTSGSLEDTKKAFLSSKISQPRNFDS